MNSNLKYYLAFSKLEGIGGLSMYDVLVHFGTLKEAWNASVLDWMHFSSLRKKTIENFKEKQKNINLEELEKEVFDKNISVVTIEDADYPKLLKEIYNPPIILFIMGDLKSCNLNKTLGVVGSRKCSIYAVESTKKIISQMQGSGITIVSGGASGIDTALSNSQAKQDLILKDLLKSKKQLMQRSGMISLWFFTVLLQFRKTLLTSATNTVQISQEVKVFLKKCYLMLLKTVLLKSTLIQT